MYKVLKHIMFCIWISDLKDLCCITMLSVTFLSLVTKPFPPTKHNPLHGISAGIVSWVCSFCLVFKFMCHICISIIYESLTCQSLRNYPAASCSLLLEVVGYVCGVE